MIKQSDKSDGRNPSREASPELSDVKRSQPVHLSVTITPSPRSTCLGPVSNTIIKALKKKDEGEEGVAAEAEATCGGN